MSQQQVNLSTVSGFSSVLKNYERSIAMLLQSKYGISAEEFYVTCVNAVKKNPKLLQCDPRSLFGAILLSAEVGLRPNTPDQHAFIIPYKGEAKFQLGYKGLVEMMYRNPRVRNIYAEAVFENDEFDYGYGLEPFLHHKPFRNGDRGSLICVYAVCKLADADPVFTVVEKSELDKIKTFSQSAMGDNAQYSPYNSGTDVHHFMEIKAALKKLSKLIPKQGVIEISKAIDYDSRFEGGAKVYAEIPQNGNQVIQANVTDETMPKGLEGAFTQMESFEAPQEREVAMPQTQGQVVEHVFGAKTKAQAMPIQEAQEVQIHEMPTESTQNSNQAPVQEKQSKTPVTESKKEVHESIPETKKEQPKVQVKDESTKEQPNDFTPINNEPVKTEPLKTELAKKPDELKKAKSSTELIIEANSKDDLGWLKDQSVEGNENEHPIKDFLKKENQDNSEVSEVLETSETIDIDSEPTFDLSSFDMLDEDSFEVDESEDESDSQNTSGSLF